MSQLTHSQPRPMKFRLRGMVALWAATVAAALGATVFLVASDGDEVQPSSAVPSAVVERAPGIRYDGGPEEGAHGISHARAQSTAVATRYDGGPEEGAHGITHTRAQSTAPAARYDGGPEEGSRGIVR